jgi:hypothetical protein
MPRRRLHQAAGEAEGARLHRLGNVVLHGVELVGPGLVRGDAHHRAADRVMAHQLADVDAAGRMAGQKLAHRAPGVAEAAVLGAGDLEVLAQVLGRDRRRRQTAIAVDDRRHALRDLADGVRVDRQVEVVVGMHVDEARGDDAAFGIEPLRRHLAREIAHRGDAADADRDVGAHARRTAAVDHMTAMDEQIVHGSPPCRRQPVASSA